MLCCFIKALPRNGAVALPKHLLSLTLLASLGRRARAYKATPQRSSFLPASLIPPSDTASVMHRPRQPPVAARLTAQPASRRPGAPAPGCLPLFLPHRTRDGGGDTCYPAAVPPLALPCQAPPSPQPLSGIDRGLTAPSEAQAVSTPAASLPGPGTAPLASPQPQPNSAKGARPAMLRSRCPASATTHHTRSPSLRLTAAILPTQTGRAARGLPGSRAEGGRW